MTPEQEAAERADLGQPGSRPDYHGAGLHIPIIVYGPPRGWRRLTAHGGHATPEAATAVAAKVIARERANLARDLLRPEFNYLREKLGLPPLERAS